MRKLSVTVIIDFKFNDSTVNSARYIVDLGLAEYTPGTYTMDGADWVSGGNTMNPESTLQGKMPQSRNTKGSTLTDFEVAYATRHEAFKTLTSLNSDLSIHSEMPVADVIAREEMEAVRRFAALVKDNPKWFQDTLNRFYDIENGSISKGNIGVFITVSVRSNDGETSSATLLDIIEDMTRFTVGQ